MLRLVEIREGIAIALDSLWSNKFRSFLTILGVLIGVASVIGMVSLIEGFNTAFTGEVEGLGANLVFVSRFEPNTDYDELSDEERKRKPITATEAEAIRDNGRLVKAVSPQNYFPGGNIVKYGNEQAKSPSVFGTWPQYQDVNRHYPERGRFFTDAENLHAARVCVVGSDLAEALFGKVDPLGKEILVNNAKFVVLGVMASRGQTFGDNPNNFVAIPLGTFAKLYPWEKELYLAASAKSADLVEDAKEEIIQILRIHRGVPYDKPNDFAVFTQKQIIRLFEDITSTVFTVMIVISSIGLMVGGVGVLNIMLVSVTERTREIGVRKAIGAKKLNILFQFLVEAVTLSCTGGFIGIGIGVLISLAACNALKVPFALPIFGIVSGFCVAVGVGLVSGIYPAYRAARVDPIVSLRYE